MKGYECPECKTTELLYEQVHGMRIKKTKKDGSSYYSAYCPKCKKYFKMDK